MLALTKKAIYSILIFFIAVFISSSFFLRAEYNFGIYGDEPIIKSQNLDIFIFFIIAIVLSTIILYRLCLKLNKYSSKIVIPITLLASFTIQLGFIFAFTRLPTDDSQTVLSIALNMLYNNDYSSLKSGGYLYMFPHNLAIVFYLKSLLYVFPNNYLVIKIFNILFSLVNTLMIYLIYKEINYKSKEKDYGVLIFAATYLPSIFMSNFIYNDIIATAFFISAIYFSIKFIKERAIKFIIMASVLLAIGNYFRSVGVIILIAAVMYILFHLKNIGIKNVMTALCIMVLTFNIPSFTENAVLQATGIVNESIYENNAPIYMWLNMGINMDRFGFWDNMQSYNIYQRQANYNKEKSTELYKNSIKEKLSKATAFQILNMYCKKLIWTWTEGTYQTDRYGLGNEVVKNDFRSRNNFSWANPQSGNKGLQIGGVLGGYSYKTFATKIFEDGSTYRSALMWMLYVINFLMYCFIFIRLIIGMKTKRFDEVFLILVVLGFIGFYLLWEIKSRYIYPVYPILIILSYMGFKDVYDLIVERNLLKFLSLRKRV